MPEAPGQGLTNKNTMKNKMKNLFSSFALAVLFAAFAPIVAPATASAGDLSYATLTPQTGDSDLVMKNKSTLAAAPKLNANITATGTTSVAAVVLDRVIVNTAGSADSKVVLTDGTAAIASVSTSSQVALNYGVALTSGSLKAVTTGTTAANVTVTYR